MFRKFSLEGVLTLLHLGLVVMAILYNQSLAGPDGVIYVDAVPAYQLMMSDFALFVVSLPIGWMFMTPTHTGGPSVSDIVLSAVGLGLNSVLVGSAAGGILSKWFSLNKEGDDRIVNN